jgi:hypothetical protein
MQKLVRACWEKDPEKRPSFHEIFSWVQSEKFAILPEANAMQVAEFCDAVLQSEQQARIRF